MTRQDEGLKSESLRLALSEALAGKTAELERLLAFWGAVVTAKPNLKLAAAFGAEVSPLPGAIAPLLHKLGRDDAAPDTDRAFLPIAAAHGWAGRLRAGREVAVAWSALSELAADERAPVRLGTRDALIGLGVRDGGGDELVARATSWLEAEDREQQFGAAALMVEVFAERRVLSSLRAPKELLAYLSAVMALVADAPRSAERLDARRRLLLSLPPTLALVVASLPAADPAAWLGDVCREASHPHLRQALSDGINRLRAPALGQGPTVVADLRAALESSAKPLRHADRVREGTGRGKASRRTR